MSEPPDRLRAHQPIGTDEEVFRLLMDSLEDVAIIILDRDGKVTRWGSSAERLLGYRTAEVIGTNASRFFIPGEIREGRPDLELQQAIATGRAEHEDWLVRKDGSRFWASRVTTALRDKNGQVIGFAQILRDLTERRRAEAEREELLERINAQRVWLETVIDQTPAGIVLIEGAAGERIVANRHAIELLGEPVPIGTLTERTVDVRSPEGVRYQPEQLVRVRVLRGEVIAGEEEIIRRPDGKEVPVVVSARPIRDTRGKITGAVVIFDDISPVKELERLREEWISIIAHDLRQPVTVISAYANLLMRRVAAENSAIRSDAEHILTSSRRLSQMIGDLLEFSRIESRRLTIERETVSLPELAQNVVERAATTSRRNQVLVLVQGHVPPLKADPGRLEQILGNLLSNAFKYSYPDTDIVVGIRGEADHVEVSVTNRGQGIEPSELPLLFTRFYRTQVTKGDQIPGLGLGLYITKGLVEAHGGRIWVESIPGQTTTFRFTLPIDLPSNGDA